MEEEYPKGSKTVHSKHLYTLSLYNLVAKTREVLLMVSKKDSWRFLMVCPHLYVREFLTCRECLKI